jgi:predicted proteasome-type protease
MKVALTIFSWEWKTPKRVRNKVIYRKMPLRRTIKCIRLMSIKTLQSNQIFLTNPVKFTFLRFTSTNLKLKFEMKLMSKWFKH